jgi:hypothetical protein
VGGVCQLIRHFYPTRVRGWNLRDKRGAFVKPTAATPRCPFVANQRLARSFSKFRDHACGIRGWKVRSKLRYTDAIRLAPRTLRGLPAQLPSRAGRPVGSCTSRPDSTLRTRAGCLSVGAPRSSRAACSRRAAPPFGEVASNAGSSLPRAACGVRATPGNTVASSVGSRPLWACGEVTTVPRSVGPEALYNLAVDTDAQLHTLAALALVGRRSPLR